MDDVLFSMVMQVERCANDVACAESGPWRLARRFRGKPADGGAVSGRGKGRGVNKKSSVSTI
jgi:hypothetical protein